MSPWIRLALREFRGSGGRLLFFAACLSVGVAAVVSVAGLSSALDSGIQSQARQLLAADLAVESRRAIPAEVLDAIDALPGASRAEVTELPSVVSVSEAPGPSAAESALCELKAVGDGYPYYGRLSLEPDRQLAELLADGGVVVGPELLGRLGIGVGDDLKIGEAVFTINGTVLAEPDRLGMSFTLGPRVFLSREGLLASQLTGSGSRVVHKSLVRLPAGATPADVRQAAERLRDALPEQEFASVETYVEAQPSLRDGLLRVERFLGLVALLSLLIGGIGVAQSIRAWLAGRLDSIAILRALGARPREVFALYLGQTTFLALCGSLFGALLGTLIAQVVPRLLADLLPVQVRVGWQPLALSYGVALGVGVALLFGLGPLTDVLRVPPARVLRRDAEPLPVARPLALAQGVILVCGVALIAAVQSGSLTRGLQFAGGLVVITAALVATTRAVVWAVGRSPRGGSVALRHGMAALARPGAGTLGAVVALGLGVMVVLAMYLVQDRMSAQLRADLPADAPTVFLVDIQPDQWDGVQRVLSDADAQRVDSVEVVVARLRAVDGVAVEDLVPPRGSADAGDRRWVLTREQRLTSMKELPPGNVIVEGALWADPARDELSVEREFARDMGVRLGSVVNFDVQGVPLELAVTSIRTVEWERFSINFFLVVEPGVLDDAPRFRVATARLAEGAEQPAQNTLAAAFPNITLLKIRDVLDKVVAILTQVSRGVRLLGGFTVLAGIAILTGAIGAGAAHRGREVALYKTLGMTRAQVVAAFATEYALIGLVAGAIGTLGGISLAWIVTRFGFELPWAFLPGAYLFAIAATVVVTVTAGLSASVRALLVRPLAVLRDSA